MFRLIVMVTSLLLVAGCASTPPTQIGADTYYAAKTNTAGAFGDPATVAGSLMIEGNKFCAKQGKQFELVTEKIAPSRFATSLGGASITFKCVNHPGKP